ncbi:unnamed protein product [Ectocarpus fasciculatus]
MVWSYMESNRNSNVANIGTTAVAQAAARFSEVAATAYRNRNTNISYDAIDSQPYLGQFHAPNRQTANRSKASKKRHGQGTRNWASDSSDTSGRGSQQRPTGNQSSHSPPSHRPPAKHTADTHRSRGHPEQKGGRREPPPRQQAPPTTRQSPDHCLPPHTAPAKEAPASNAMVPYAEMDFEPEEEDNGHPQG